MILFEYLETTVIGSDLFIIELISENYTLCVLFQKFEEDLMRQEAKLRETLSIGQDILKRCHPDALTTLKHWLSVLRARWEEVWRR